MPISLQWGSRLGELLLMARERPHLWAISFSKCAAGMRHHKDALLQRPTAGRRARAIVRQPLHRPSAGASVPRGPNKRCDP